MDNNLKITIQKIRLLSEQNAEFKLEMQKLFGNEVSASSSKSNEERITNIEKYLGLDYYVDTMPSLIDYSYIKEPDVRAQLISDNREMLRFRYGTRFHSIKFDEFCRYAQLQAEMLINYFYYKVDDNIEASKEHIKKQNEKGYIGETVKNLGDITFNTKLWAIENEFKIDILTTLNYVREVRNEQSHRGPKEIEMSIKGYQEKLQKWRIVLNEDGSVWKNNQKDPLGRNMYDSKVKGTEEFKLYNYLLWLKREPFDEIISAIKRLSLCVKNEIQ